VPIICTEAELGCSGSPSLNFSRPHIGNLESAKNEGISDILQCPSMSVIYSSSVVWRNGRDVIYRLQTETKSEMSNANSSIGT
jgi:hypothetical protein